MKMYIRSTIYKICFCFLSHLHVFLLVGLLMDSLPAPLSSRGLLQIQIITIDSRAAIKCRRLPQHHDRGVANLQHVKTNRRTLEEKRVREGLLHRAPEELQDTLNNVRIYGQDQFWIPKHLPTFKENIFDRIYSSFLSIKKRSRSITHFEMSFCYILRKTHYFSVVYTQYIANIFQCILSCAIFGTIFHEQKYILEQHKQHNFSHCCATCIYW